MQHKHTIYTFEFDITTMVFQNKHTDVITSFICYMIDMVSLMYSRIYSIKDVDVSEAEIKMQKSQNHVSSVTQMSHNSQKFLTIQQSN